MPDEDRRERVVRLYVDGRYIGAVRSLRTDKGGWGEPFVLHRAPDGSVTASEWKSWAAAVEVGLHVFEETWGS